MASTAALLGLGPRPGEAGAPPPHPLSPTQYLAGLHSSPTSSLRLPSHAEYLSAAATAQRLGELQQAAQASLDVPFSLDGKLQTVFLVAHRTSLKVNWNCQFFIPIHQYSIFKIPLDLGAFFGGIKTQPLDRRVPLSVNVKYESLTFLTRDYKAAL